MVQEVQQQGNWYQTPNEIQGIGDTRRRVREHTQVTPSFSYECTVSGSVSVTGAAYETKTEMGTINSITSSYGITVFKLFDDGIEIPLAGAYLVELKAKGGVAAVPFTHTLMVDNKDLLSSQTTTSSSRDITNKILNLGRGNVIKYKVTAANSAGGSFSFNGNILVTLRKL